MHKSKPERRNRNKENVKTAKSLIISNKLSIGMATDMYNMKKNQVFPT